LAFGANSFQSFGFRRLAEIALAPVIFERHA